MKVYRLDFKSVSDDPMAGISSNYVSPRHHIKSEHYLTKAQAQARMDEVYDGLLALLGFVPKAELAIVEIEVME